MYAESKPKRDLLDSRRVEIEIRNQIGDKYFFETVLYNVVL